MRPITFLVAVPDVTPLSTVNACDGLPRANAESALVRVVRRVVLGVLCSSLFNPVANRAAAQIAHEPFERISVAIEMFSDFNQSTFHEFWNPKPGGGLSLGTPFYAGDVSVGFWRHANEAVQDDASDFTTTYVYVGWDLALRLPADVAWHNGVVVGTYRMDLTDTDVNANEQELGWGFRSAASYRLGRAWSVYLSGTYLGVMTHTRIHHLLLGIGVTRSFPTPQWLREVLQ